MANPGEEAKAKLLAERQRVKELNNSALVVGEQWAIVAMRWWRLWQEFTSDAKLGDENHNPGPIDNSSITDDSGNMREHLLPETDYTFVHREAWQLLVSHYGAGQHPLVRSTIEKGKFVRTLEIEVYPLDIQLAQYNQPDMKIRRKFSRTAPFTEVEEEMRRAFQINSERPTRLWVSLTGTNYELLSNKQQRIDEQVYNNQYVLLEVQNEDGSWPRGQEADAAKFSRSPPASGILATAAASASPMLTRSAAGTLIGRAATPGLCGLSNLGNTCFMNSALQALSHVHLLTEYFLSDLWHKELNVDNPLGMHGEIARRYGQLVKEIWSGVSSHVSPREFKLAVGQFAPQFSGFQQQDSQELMAFLLDGLHEDLNRIKRKPYVELKDSDGRPDHIVAAEAWSDYKKRNDSVIVDNFHGQLKSTLVCPDCRKVSITFDPFCYLSLPVPSEQQRVLMFYLVRADPALQPLKCKVIVPIKGTISQLCCEIGAHFKVRPECLLLADVYNNKFHKVFAPDDHYMNISNERDMIYAYELEQPLADPTYAVVKVYFSTTIKYSHLLGLPIVFSLPAAGVTYSQLNNTVMDKAARFLSLHLADPTSSTWWRRNSSTNDDEGICDSGEEEEEAQTGEGAQAQPPLFSLLRTNSNLAMETSLAQQQQQQQQQQEQQQQEEPLKLPRDLYLIARFQPKAKELFFNEQNAKSYEEDASLSLRLQKPTHHLEDCLKLFTEEEVLGEKDAWYCPKCRKSQCATKKFDLWSLPRVLVIHLKRFHYDRFFRKKIDKLIEFPIRGLDIGNWLLNSELQSPASYDLISVVNHYGGLGGGHYTAFGRNYRNNQWYHFDDSCVTLTDESQIVTKAAYVLIYARADLLAFGDSASDEHDLMDVS